MTTDLESMTGEYLKNKSLEDLRLLSQKMTEELITPLVSAWVVIFDELARRLEEAQQMLNEIYDRFSIGLEVRTASTLLTNLDNVIRRSNCLSSIEAHHTSIVMDDDGEEYEEQLLNWGETPEDYISTYKTVLATHDAELTAKAKAEALAEAKLKFVDAEYFFPRDLAYLSKRLDEWASEYRAKATEAGRKE